MVWRTRWLGILACTVAGCSSSSAVVSPSTTARPAAAPVAAAPSSTTVSTTSAPATTTPPATTTTAVSATSTTSAPRPTTTPYGMPVADGARAGYAHTHHDYPASDVFVGCGASIVSPVNGTVLEARRVDGWTAVVDNPATRGGKSVSILGDDGVRYYLAHFESIIDGIEPQVRVTIGDPLGVMGRTGRAGACHVHVAISPPCPGREWAVRRGVIWPWRYLDAWRAGEQLSPAAEIYRWLLDHPDACTEAMADPYAADS